MSRHDLPDPVVDRYTRYAYDYVMDLLVRLDRSEPFRHDPSGEEPLQLAKRIRRQTLGAGGGGIDALVDEAERHFAMPESALDYAGRAEGLTPPRETPEAD